MQKRILNVCVCVSTGLFVIFIGLYVYVWIFNPKLYPPSFRIPLCVASMTVTKSWGGNAIFFNQNVPYTGGTISISKDLPINVKGWDRLGVYFRLISDARRSDNWWTLMVSLWYPIIIFGILPAAYMVQKLRGTKSVTQSEGAKNN